MSTPDDRIAANAALLRLFKNEYRESSDRHSDALFAREYVGTIERENVHLERENAKLREALERIYHMPVSDRKWSTALDIAATALSNI